MSVCARLAAVVLALGLASIAGAGCKGGDAPAAAPVTPVPPVTNPAVTPSTDPSGGSTPAAGSGSGPTSGSEAQPPAPPVSQGVPDTTAIAGQLILDVTGVDPANVSGYIVGDQAKTIQLAGNGQLYIDGVPPGMHDVVITAGTLSVATLALAESDGFGRRLNDVEVKKNERTNPGKFDLPKAGSITGNAKRSGQSTHLGIEVGIPGTGYQATTDAAGNFSILNVPVGIHELAYRYQSYHNGYVKNLEVESATNTVAPDIVLTLSNGADGVVVLNDGAASTNSRNVSVIIAASETALQMKISHDPNFSGIPYRNVATSTTYSFPADGSSTLYVKLADENGLENTISSSILVDTSPPSPFNVTNAPTGVNNVATLNVTVSGTDLSPVHYKFKVGVAASTDCAAAIGYGASTAATQLITASVADLADGEIKLCVLGGDALGNFQALANATAVTWTKDRTPAQVSGHTPVGPGASIHANIAATFTESVENQFQVSGGANFTVTDVDENLVVAGDRNYVDGTKTATFDPTLRLNGTTQYSVRISKDVSDLVKNAMPADFTWSFTTGAGWKQPKRTDATTTDAFRPVVAVLGGGDRVAAFVRRIGANVHVVAHIYDAATKTWGDEQQLSVTPVNESQSRIRIASDGDNDAAVVWVGSDFQVNARRLKTRAWQTIEILESDTSSIAYPLVIDVAMNSLGHAVAVWPKALPAQTAGVYASFFDGTTWSAKESVENSVFSLTVHSIRVAINDNDRIIAGIGTTEQAPQKVFVSTANGSTWNNNVNPPAHFVVDESAGTATQGDNIAVVIGSNNVGTIAWTDYSNLALNAQSFTIDSNGTATAGTATVIDNTAGRCMLGVNLGIDGSNNVFATYIQDSSTNCDSTIKNIMASRFNGTSWSTTQLNTVNSNANPQIAVNASGKAILTWVLPADQRIVSSIYDGSWSSPPLTVENLGLANGSYEGSSIAIDAQGRGMALFEKDVTSGETRIHAAIYDVP